MTELVDVPVEVRPGAGGAVEAVRLPEGWRLVARTTNRWVVETDWWRQPVRREYRRCVTRAGDCIELSLDLDDGRWRLVRRYD